ncbi:hypothetical protein N7510_005382 [Penicillium lagena]|uniref:uncharacterized protein n=1 Tax=Penicillium lagena TaxID=94218 RepID=UPI00254091B6|nr:uncharacterized protein N7510_005382 [Penicillium lagena]KAJ5612188.1 hypothetical protein N7510_005382 [Penicillium lagena]
MEMLNEKYSNPNHDTDRSSCNDSEQDHLLETELADHPPRRRAMPLGKLKCVPNSHRVILWLNIILFIANISGMAYLIIKLPRVTDTVAKWMQPQIIAPSPALDVVEHSLHRFTDPDREATPWSGPPSDETDQAWEELINNGRSFPIDPDMFQALNGHPETGVRIPNDTQGRFVGILEVTHQLHCVDIMRRGAWFNFEHYRDKQFFGNKSDDAIMWHMRHCFEVLRQTIQCHGDTSVLTYNWIKGYSAPKSAWKSLHTCQNWERLMEWRKQNDITPKLKFLDRPLWVMDPDGVVPGAQGAAEGNTHDGTTADHV